MMDCGCNLDPEPCAVCARLPADFYDSDAEQLAAETAYELFQFSLLRWRREAQKARLNWYWQENTGYDPDRPRNEKIHWCGCPNVKGWWMSGFEDLWFQDPESTLDAVDSLTGEVLIKGEKLFPHVVELHNRHARYNRQRLKRQQRRAGMRPTFRTP